jgi:hypothetical protein
VLPSFTAPAMVGEGRVGDRLEPTSILD